MSTAQTVLEYIEALRWPVVVGGIAFVLRKSIKKAAENFKMPTEGSVKVPAIAEVNWKNEVNQVAAQIELVEEQSVSAATTADLDSHDIDPEGPEAIDIVMRFSGLRDAAWEAIERAVLVDPTGAVVGAWGKVEGAILTVGRDGGRTQGTTVQRVLSNLNIPDELSDLIRDLRKLRNEVAHGRASVDSEVALTYVQSAKRIVAILAIAFPTAIF